DVVPCSGWSTELRRDLQAVAPDVAGIRGRVLQPIGTGEPPTDREVDGKGGDIAYRTSALRRLGGFDERLTTVSREDVDLALRAERAGLRLVAGRRTVMHPDWPAGPQSHIHAAWHRLVDALRDVVPRRRAVTERGSGITIAP